MGFPFRSAGLVVHIQQLLGPAHKQWQHDFRPHARPSWILGMSWWQPQSGLSRCHHEAMPLRQLMTGAGLSTKLPRQMLGCGGMAFMWSFVVFCCYFFLITSSYFSLRGLAARRAPGSPGSPEKRLGRQTGGGRSGSHVLICGFS